MKKETNQYPRWLYHPRHAGRVFETKKETKWLWLFGWRDRPYPAKEDRLNSKLKVIWSEYKWFIEALGLFLGIAAALYKFF